MKSLIYIGNMPATKGVDTVMGAHIALLEPHFKVYFASQKRNKILRLLDMVATLLRRQKKADYVLISVYSTLNFYYAWIIACLCRLLKKPYLAYLHGGNLPARLLNSPKMSQAVFGHSTANVAPSDYLKVAFERHGFKAVCIPNFIEIENYPFQHRTRLRPNLLWVRSFEKTYDPEMTIRVFAELCKTYPTAKLCMVGPDKDGSLERCKTLASELGLSSQITFTGGLPKSEWIALAKDFDVFINTTRFDNTPISVMEAMALGLPVVSTNVGGLPYLISNGNDGLLSDSGNVKAMVENLHKLLKFNGLASSISKNARQKATSFDWKIIEKQWLALLPPKP